MAISAEQEKKFRFRARLEAEQAAVQPTPEPEMSIRETVEGGVNALTQGMTLGFADEIGTGIAAGAVKIGDFLTGTDGEDYSDIYAGMMDSEKAKRERFAKENAKTALALEVAGGFATGGAGGAKVLGARTLANASKLKKTLAAVGVGATEGGVAGFGSGDSLDDRLGKAGQGATIGAVLPLAMTGAGQVARKVSSKSRHMPDLDTPEGFTPLNVAAPDSKRGRLTQLAGDAFGGGRVGIQGQKVVDRVAAKVDAQGKMVDKAAGVGKSALKKSVARIKAATQTKTDEIDAAFRSEAQYNSAPTSMGAAARQALQDLPPQDAAEQLNKYWVKHGFESAKKQTFDMDGEKFEASLKSMLKDDPALRDKAGDFTKEIMGDFNKVFKRPKPIQLPTGITSSKIPTPTTGKIAGAELMELRNKYARSANSTPDGLQRTAYRKIANKIDTEITRRLKGKDLAEYRDDMSKWEAFSTYKDATGKAANRKQGLFTQDDWLSATKNYKLGQGKGVLQDSAQEGQKAKSALNKTMGENITKRTESIKSRSDKVRLGSKRKLADLKKEHAKTAKAAFTTKNTGSRLLNTGILGGIPSGLSAMGALPAGAATANILSRPAMQRAMVGQSAKQKKLRELLENYDAGSVNGMSIADILRQGLSSGVVAAQ